jgi:ABC-type glycerol-3-phosphate transport system substrate-binding protein
MAGKRERSSGKKRIAQIMLLTIIVLIGLVSMIGCGGGGGSSAASTSSSTTTSAPHSGTVTVTATSGALTHAVVVNVIVN